MPAAETITAIDTIVGVEAMPDDLLTIADLPAVDYANQVSVPTELPISPELWARTLLGDVPSAAERLVWNGILRFGLPSTASAHTIAGWRIGGRGPHWIRLVAQSAVMAGNIIIRTTDGRVSMATLVHYRNALAKPIWTLLTPVHTGVMPKMLQAAIDRLTVEQERPVDPGSRARD